MNNDCCVGLYGLGCRTPEGWRWSEVVGCSLPWGDSSRLHEMPWLWCLIKASLASSGISLIHASSPNYCGCTQMWFSVVKHSNNGFWAVLLSVSQMEPWFRLKAPERCVNVLPCGGCAVSARHPGWLVFRKPPLSSALTCLKTVSYPHTSAREWLCSGQQHVVKPVTLPLQSA